MDESTGSEQTLTATDRQRRLAQQVHEQREDDVLDLHNSRSAHYVDNAFSLVTANMAVVSLVLGAVYISRDCEKPLASFLIVLGLLAPFAACLPVLIRQWFYLHLRVNNGITIGLFLVSALYVAWLLVGQRWAFASSATTCDPDLSTAANVVVFVLYLMLLLYSAKVVWYLLARVRYSYKQLCLSCFRDPYPNALAMSEVELDQLEVQIDEYSPPKPTPKNRVLVDMQRHQHELRTSLYRLFHRDVDGSSTGKLPAPSKKKEATPKVEPLNWSLDFRKSSSRAKRARVVASDGRTTGPRTRVHSLPGKSSRHRHPRLDAATATRTLNSSMEDTLAADREKRASQSHAPS